MPKYDLTSYPPGGTDWTALKDLFLRRLAQNQSLAEPVRALTYSASMTPDLTGLTRAHLTITVTNTTAFTMNAPTNAEDGCELWLDFLNSSGGTMGAVTWNAAYVFDTAWSSPSNGNHRLVGFYRSGAKWIQMSGSAGGGAGSVTSVFGRSGAVVAASGDYTFAQIGSTPTTLSGYGITDAVQNAGSTPSIQSGTHAARPAAGTAGRLYYETDTFALFHDTGVAWDLGLPALTGDITTPGNSLATTLKNTGTAGTYVKVTTDAQGRVTAGSASPQGVTDGGTGLSSCSSGDLFYGSAANTIGKVAQPTDTRNNILVSNQGLPFWKVTEAAAANSANQATFTNTATNITGCSFSVVAGEEWRLFFIVPLRSTSGTAGCAFAFTLPASSTGAMTLHGNTSSATATTTIYSAAPTTFTAASFCTAATTDLVVYIALAVTAGATGTVQLQGKSGGSTTSIQINNGAMAIGLLSY